MRLFLGVALSSAAMCLCLPAVAGQKPATLQSICVSYFHAAARDVSVLATALPLAHEGSPGSAALVRVADGSDGGNPTCHLVLLAGRPSGPGMVQEALRLDTCPHYDKDKKGALLSRVALGANRAAWQLKLQSQRMDAIAKGVEAQQLWALASKASAEAPLKLVWSFLSTSFTSQNDPRMNQSETCETPIIQAGSDAQGLTLSCDTMAMLGSLPKRERIVRKFRWSGEDFQPE